MANICTFNLRVFGTREQCDEVAQHITGRLKTIDGRLLIDGDDWWVELWAKNPESVCQQSDNELLIEGESRDLPGLHLAKELSERFPELKIHIGGSDEEGFGEVWQLIGGEGRLLDRDGPLVFNELGFGIGYWLVRDGQVVTPEQRQAWIAEDLAKIEASDKEEYGTNYSAEEQERRQVVIRQEIEQLEQWIQRDAEPSVATAESSIGNFQKEGL